MDDIIHRITGKNSSEEIIREEYGEAVYKEFDLWVSAKIKTIHPLSRPYLINISGIPCAGKSTLSQKILNQNPFLLYISFDEIMESLSLYQNDYKSHGQEYAFKKWEIPARYLGYKLLQTSIKNNYPILFEHSNANTLHIDLYRWIKNQGYYLEIRFINIDIDSAEERSKKRNRYMPLEIIKERYEQLQKINLKLQLIADKFEIISP